VLRTTTGIATVIGVDQRFADIGDGRREPEHGVTAYADVEDALPHVDAQPDVNVIFDLAPHSCLSRACCLDLVERDFRCLDHLGLNADKASENCCFLCPYHMYQHLSG
jgi:hypothetical protein